MIIYGVATYYFELEYFIGREPYQTVYIPKTKDSTTYHYTDFDEFLSFLSDQGWKIIAIDNRVEFSQSEWDYQIIRLQKEFEYKEEND